MSDPARILVVEDDKNMSKFICFKLNYMGYEVVGLATNAADAIQLTKKHQPDLILMDILLENNDDGIVTANKILTFADIPIVYLTAHEDPELFERARISKPFGYLIKPFNDRDLNLVIETATYRQKQKIKLARALEDARNIINSSLMMIITVDNDDLITEFNEAAKWELGFAHDEVLGKNILDLMVDEKYLTEIKTRLQQALTFDLELKIKHQSGAEKSCLFSVSRLRDSQNNSKGFLLISH
ncbi:MAG: response regulator [Candidatus Marinimicrobia bacterium]|nr:response regulator [Candidatus Neomarinimicrobiota bacterium]